MLDRQNHEKKNKWLYETMRIALTCVVDLRSNFDVKIEKTF